MWREFIDHDDIFSTITKGIENIPAERELDEAQSLDLLRRTMNEGLLFVFGVDKTGKAIIGHTSQYYNQKQAFDRLYSVCFLSSMMYDETQKTFLINLSRILNTSIKKYDDDKAAQEHESWIIFLSNMWRVSKSKALDQIRKKRSTLDHPEKTAWFFGDVK